MQFFIPADFNLTEVQSSLGFRTQGLPENPKYFPETISVDFENDWADDKPGYLVPMSQIAGEVFFPSSPTVSEAFPETVQKCAGKNGLDEWFYFSRVLIEVDRRFEWDFDDEEGMENYDEKIKFPFFQALRLEFKNLMVANYSLDFYEGH